MLEQITHDQFVAFLAADTKLQQLGMDHSARKAIQSRSWFLQEPYYLLGYYLDGELITVINLVEISNAAIQVHWYCASKYWGTGQTQTIVEETVHWARVWTNYLSAIIYVPVRCEIVLKTVAAAGFNMTGLIPKGVYWEEGEAYDLALMHKLLREEVQDGRK